MSQDPQTPPQKVTLVFTITSFAPYIEGPTVASAAVQGPLPPVIKDILITNSLTQGPKIVFQVKKDSPYLTDKLTIICRTVCEEGADIEYQPVGLSFWHTRSEGKGGNSEFSSIIIANENPDPDTVKQLAITNELSSTRMGVPYQYKLFVQRMTDGKVGVVDPDIETDAVEP